MTSVRGEPKEATRSSLSSKFDSGKCGSAWVAYQQTHDRSLTMLTAGHCCVGRKAEVYGAKLHAIQEGSSDDTEQWTPPLQAPHPRRQPVSTYFSVNWQSKERMVRPQSPKPSHSSLQQAGRCADSGPRPLVGFRKTKRPTPSRSWEPNRQ